MSGVFVHKSDEEISSDSACRSMSFDPPEGHSFLGYSGLVEV